MDTSKSTKNSSPVSQTIRANSALEGDHCIKTLVTPFAKDVDHWIRCILSFHSNRGDNLIVGLDTEWRLVKEANGHRKVALLQLCVGHRCLIFQIYIADSIPNSLKEFLNSPSHVFVGKCVHDDAQKLMHDYQLGVSSLLDVVDMAAERYGKPKLRTWGLKKLASAFLGLEMEKSKSITLSQWDKEMLGFGQVKYACLDAFVSFKLGLAILKGKTMYKSD